MQLIYHLFAYPLLPECLLTIISLTSHYLQLFYTVACKIAVVPTLTRKVVNDLKIVGVPLLTRKVIHNLKSLVVPHLHTK